MRFSWQNLQTLAGQEISHYFIVVKNSYGNGVNGYIVPGNTTSHVLSGLSPYTEYRLSVVGVNFRGNAYNSTERTAWTDEGGTCNRSKDVVLFFMYCWSQVYLNKRQKLLVCEESSCDIDSAPLRWSISMSSGTVRVRSTFPWVKFVKPARLTFINQHFCCCCCCCYCCCCTFCCVVASTVATIKNAKIAWSAIIFFCL